ncbi:MAG: hypothetical protein D6705_12020 [Deltaproteobacteria bacterium]|nr:MAG: hypothetical protein D6705_12020 [Deltaproteobacteria bacterium]
MTGQLLVWGALALAAAGLWWVRRHQEAARARGVLGTVRLGTSHALYVVEVEGRRLLVGTGPGGAPEVLADLSEDATAVVPSASPCREGKGGVGGAAPRTRVAEEAA